MKRDGTVSPVAWQVDDLVAALSSGRLSYDPDRRYRRPAWPWPPPQRKHPVRRLSSMAPVAALAEAEASNYRSKLRKPSGVGVYRGDWKGMA